jgi:steroid delta-isomerase-like uncharacterized protein
MSQHDASPAGRLAGRPGTPADRDRGRDLDLDWDLHREDANKALARRWFAEGWSRGNLAIAEEIFAPDFTLRGRLVGPDGPRRSVADRRRAFADLTATVDLQVAEGDLVVTHFTTRARHVAEFCGVPGTGRWVVASGVVIWRVRDGLVREDWNAFDRWGVVRQIGQ